MSAQPRPAVPGGPSVVGVLAIAVGILQLLAGLVFIIWNPSIDGYSSGEAVLEGIVLLIAGAIYVWVGRGLLRGNRLAYLIGVLVMAFRVAYDVAYLLFTGLDGVGFAGLISLIINVLILAALYSGRQAFSERPAQAGS
jgi:hypothetical protein